MQGRDVELQIRSSDHVVTVILGWACQLAFARVTRSDCNSTQCSLTLMPRQPLSTQSNGAVAAVEDSTTSLTAEPQRLGRTTRTRLHLAKPMSMLELYNSLTTSVPLSFHLTYLQPGSHL